MDGQLAGRTDGWTEIDIHRLESVTQLAKKKRRKPNKQKTMLRMSMDVPKQ